MLKIIDKCIVCDSLLERVKDRLYCVNPSCSAKSSKNLLHFVKTMKVMGLGEKTLQKLEVNTVHELYMKSEKYITQKLGEKIGTKVYNELEKSKNTTIQKFISSLGIPLIGKTAGEKIHNTVSSMSEITVETCKKAGLGDKATKNLMNWMDNNWFSYADLPFIFEESEPVISGLVVCISGKVPGYTKATIKEMLLDYNVTTKDSVTKGLDYVISNETGTSKVKKAEQYNIQVISFEEFMEIINE